MSIDSTIIPDSGITELTGDVTAGPGTGAQAATIPNDTVTYAKMQNISAASRLIGRGSAGGAGNPEEIDALGLMFDGTTLQGGGGVLTITSTGTVHDLALAGVSLVVCNNATDLTLTGFVPDYPGQLVTFVTQGAGNVFFSYNTGSTAGNRLLTMVTSGPGTPLAAGWGSAIFSYDTLVSAWRLVSHEQGAGITATFNAANFTANGTMTWTVASGDVSAYRYYLRGKQLQCWMQFDTTTVTAPVNTQLRVVIPGGFTTSLAAQGYIFIINNSAFTSGRFYMGSSTQFYFELSTGGNWTAATNTTYIATQGQIEAT